MSGLRRNMMAVSRGAGIDWESAYRALIGDSDVTEVVIPEGVTRIRRGLFREATNLVRCVIPDSVVVTATYGLNSASYMFASCTNLQEVVIGSGFTKTGERMFNACTALTSITLPANINEIGAWTFSGCSNLTTVILERTSSIVSRNANAIDAGNTIYYVPDALLDAYMANTYWSKMSDRIKPLSELVGANE